ncbi:MAG: hypothetical protein PHD19_06530 [Dechloromonas sp.]|nr:hypothetical protein [Dechloromonas sp.]
MAAVLIDDVAVRARVQKIWESVFEVSGKILVDEKRFGFLGMEIIPDPNIHQMLAVLRTIEEGLMSVLAEFDDLQYDETRLILNAREQISRMEVVALALKRNNRDLFDEAIERLERQAAF